MTDRPAIKPPAVDWPNTIHSREQLDSALEAGLKSGTSPRSFEEIIESAKTRLKDG